MSNSSQRFLATIAVMLGSMLCIERPVHAAEPSTTESQYSAELAAFKKAIREQYDIKEKAFAEHDAETIVTKFYASDAMTVGGDEGIVVGRDAQRKMYQAFVQGYRVKVDSVTTFVNGASGWDWTDFHLIPNDPAESPQTFVVLFLWTKVDGRWVSKGDFFTPGSLRAGKLTTGPASAQ